MVETHNYDYISQFDNGIAIVRKNNLYGAILSGGRELIKPIYDYLSHFENGYSMAIKNGRTILVDLSGREYIKSSHGLFEIPQDIYDIEECGFNLYRFAIRVNESPYDISPKLKWGVMDENKEIIVKPEFDYIHDYVLNTTKACKITTHHYNSTEWFIITNKSNIGQETFEIEPAIIGEDELIITRIKCEFLDTYHTNRKDKYFSVRTNSLCTSIVFYNGNKYLLDREIYRVYSLNYGHYIVQDRSGKFGVIDRRGKIVTPLTCQSKSGVLYPHIIKLPNSSEISLPKDITTIYAFEEEYAKFRTAKGMGILNNNGVIIAKDIPYFIASYNKKLNAFILQRSEDNKRWLGLLDQKTARIIKPNYNSICSYDKNGAVVQLDDVGIFNLDKSGKCIIDHNGAKVSLPDKFVVGFGTRNNISVVFDNGLWGLYDVEVSKQMAECEYLKIEYNELGVYIAKKVSYLSQPNKWGEKQPDIERVSYDVFDITGKLILPDLGKVMPISDDKFIVYRNGVVSLVNHHNETLITHDSITIRDLGYNRVSVINDKNELRIFDYDGNLISERFCAVNSEIKVYPFESNHIAKVEWLSYSGYIDIDANLMIPYNQSFIQVPLGYDWCFDYNGRTFRCLKRFSDYQLFNNNFLAAYEIGSLITPNNIGLIYENNKLVQISTELSDVLYTSKSFSIAGIKYKDNEEFCDSYYGVLGKTGEWYINPIPYPKFDYLSKNILIIERHSYPTRKALLNHKKGLISDFKYTEVELAKDNRTIIVSEIDEEFSKSKKWNERDKYSVVLLDENLKALVSIEDSQVSSQILSEEGCFFIIRNNSNHKYGVVNHKGKIIIPIKYSNIRQFDSSSFEVGFSYNSKGIVDFNGKIIVPIKYSTIIKNSYDSYIGIESPSNIFPRHFIDELPF